MKRSGDLVIGRSGDRKKNLSAGARRHGEQLGENLTQTRRYGGSLRSSGFSDHPITCDPPIPRSPSATALLRNVMETIRAALREIFDESAYDRFLLRTNSSRSVGSYRNFTRERDAALLKKPRCC
jgi:hypothetical protein